MGLFDELLDEVLDEVPVDFAPPVWLPSAAVSPCVMTVCVSVLVSFFFAMMHPVCESTCCSELRIAGKLAAFAELTRSRESKTGPSSGATARHPC